MQTTFGEYHALLFPSPPNSITAYLDRNMLEKTSKSQALGCHHRKRVEPPGDSGPSDQNTRLGQVNIFLPVSMTWKVNSIPLSLFISYDTLNPSSFHTCSLEKILRISLSPARPRHGCRCSQLAQGKRGGSLREEGATVRMSTSGAQKGHLQAFCCLRGIRCLLRGPEGRERMTVVPLWGLSGSSFAPEGCAQHTEQLTKHQL